MHKKFGEDRTCSSGDMIADRQTHTHRQTHRQTRSSQYSRSTVGGRVKRTGKTDTHGQISSVTVRYNVINRTITRFSIQTAGLPFGGTGLCSYRVRGVGGSRAEHLTVEPYTIIISLQSYLLYTYYYWYSITLSLFHSRLKSFLFCKSSLPQPFLFLIQVSLYGFPRLFTLLLSISVFLLFSFSVFTLFSCRFRAVD